MSLDIDLHSAVRTWDVINTHAEDGNTAAGTLRVRYEVRRFPNVQNLESKLQYYVICTARVAIAHANKIGASMTEYADYPVFLQHDLKLLCNGAALPTNSLHDYAPRTVNSSVSQSRSDTKQSNSTATVEHTVGSSTSQTNTFDANVGVGFMGQALLGNAGAGASHATTREHSASSGASTASGTSADASHGEAMTVKEWTGYGSIDRALGQVSWQWSQEYPWNFLEFNAKTADSIALPDYVVARLSTKTSDDIAMVLPPSGLSQFGIDFLMKSVWVVDAALADKFAFSHALTWWNGTHKLDKGTLKVSTSINTASLPPTDEDFHLPELSLLALDAVHGADHCRGAVIGFAPSQFIAPPSDPNFLAVSGGNNLHITGTGFDAGMKADLSGNKTASFIVSLKVTDREYDYALHIRHWKVGGTSVVLQLTINPGSAETKLVKHVDAEKSKGADRNELVIELRDQRFDSDDFHDYLVLGLNTIKIDVTSADADYRLAGVALGLVS
jgi:hypothetical protein